MPVEYGTAGKKKIAVQLAMRNLEPETGFFYRHKQENPALGIRTVVRRTSIWELSLTYRQSQPIHSMDRFIYVTLFIVATFQSAAQQKHPTAEIEPYYDLTLTPAERDSLLSGLEE